MEKNAKLRPADNTVVRWRNKAAKQGLGGLELAFPCVICSFTVVILLLCFCCCPILLYRLKGEIGFNYLALLYFILGLIVFGVVGESLLIARRRGRLGACCRSVEEYGPQPVDPRPTFSAVTVCDPHGSLKEKPGLRAPLCDVHTPAAPSGPPPSYDDSVTPGPRQGKKAS